MVRRPPRSTRTDNLCPDTTLFRSIGGHLVPPPRAVGDERGRVHPRLVDIEAAGAGERCVAALPDLRPRPGDEFVDIAVIVGEQYVALEMLGRGAGIVAQPREAERSEERRVGKECVSKCRSRGSPAI